MRRPRHARSLAVTVALLLALSACAGHSAKSGKLRNVEQVAPDYDFRDSSQVKACYALQEQLGLAGNRLSGGDLAGAEEHARKALALAPESVQAHTLLVVVAGRRGDAATAGEHYRKAAELAPNRGETLNNYGAWLCANGAAAESLQWFDRALAAPSYATPASALANAGGCALQIGQRERGGRDLRKALALQPDNAYPLEAMAREEAAQTRFFEARVFSEWRLAAAPATASVLQFSIRIEQGLGDMAAAGRYQQSLRKEFADAATTTPGASAL